MKKIIAIFRNLAMSECVSAGQALYAGGIHMMEVTFNQREPETFFQTAKIIDKMVEQFGKEVSIGAGTVISEEQVKLAKAAGASYIVTPTTQVNVITCAKELGMGCMPGALTPTEILRAYEAGADWVKVFPASSMGTSYFKALQGPLGHIPLAAVGGIDLNNMKKFLDAGAAMVGIGGNLVDKELIRRSEWEKLEEKAHAYVLCGEEN